MKPPARIATTLVLVAPAFLLTAAADRPAYLDPAQPIDARVEDLLCRMTLEEKVGQMNMPCVYETGSARRSPEKTEGVPAVRRRHLRPGSGPGGGFFTLPNTILHEGTRQQVEFLNELQRIASRRRGSASRSSRPRRARTA